MELALIFMGGFLGSSHCLGMCGGFAMLISINCETPRGAFVAQSLYTMGRLFTYTVLGALAGYGGQRLGISANQWMNVSASLCVVAGLFLIVQGCYAAGFTLWRRGPSVGGGCLVGPLFRTFFQSRSWTAKFIAGMLTGFLPCGLLYGFLALAAASQSVLQGGAILAAFALGTAPLMMLAGIGGRMLSLISRQKLLKLAAWCVILTGVLTTYRGVVHWQRHDRNPAVCPLCVKWLDTSVGDGLASSREAGRLRRNGLKAGV